MEAPAAQPCAERRVARGGISALVVALSAFAALALACGDGARAGGTPDESASDDREDVVLLHGLGRSSFSMSLLAHRLGEAGFASHNLDYPSTERPIAELVEILHGQLEACCRDSERLHFVTHSLGGVLTRAYVDAHGADRIGRVVMLGPPNAGSELVDSLRETPLLEWVLGPAALELGTDAASVPQKLNQAGGHDFELGVIAGTRSLNPIGSWMIAGPDDGIVSVESARIEGLEKRGAFLLIPVTHTFIMGSKEVAVEVEHFLRAGRFSEQGLAASARIEAREDAAAQQAD